MNPLNVVWVEPICEDFWCFVETFGTDIAGVVVAGDGASDCEQCELRGSCHV